MSRGHTAAHSTQHTAHGTPLRCGQCDAIPFPPGPITLICVHHAHSHAHRWGGGSVSIVGNRFRRALGASPVCCVRGGPWVVAVERASGGERWAMTGPMGWCDRPASQPVGARPPAASYSFPRTEAWSSRRRGGSQSAIYACLFSVSLAPIRAGQDPALSSARSRAGISSCHLLPRREPPPPASTDRHYRS